MDRDDVPLGDRGDRADAPDTTDPTLLPTTLEEATGLLGRSPALVHARAALALFAPTNATVLVLGETGTGKELAARALHALSPRAQKPFVAVNVAAIPETLLASELFGHERGAFTGAASRHRGFFEQAHGGTLFLDEIGELSPDAQASLLRVLETREVRAVGAEQSTTVDVRLVGATHRDLATLVVEGRFRADLFYRLHALVVRLPPLRERRNDIELLGRSLLVGLRAQVGERYLDLCASEALESYSWPGNVRQMRTVLLRAAATSSRVLLSSDDIARALRDEPAVLTAPSRPKSCTSTETPPALLRDLMVSCEGRIAPAAKKLGIARSTLRARLRRSGLAHDGSPLTAP